MSEIKTLEELFIRDYENLQKENESLKAKIDYQQNIIEAQSGANRINNEMMENLLDSLQLKPNDIDTTKVWLNGRLIYRKDNENLYLLLSGYIQQKYDTEKLKEQEGNEEHE